MLTATNGRFQVSAVTFGAGAAIRNDHGTVAAQTRAMRSRRTTLLAVGLWLAMVALVSVIVVLRARGWNGSGSTTSSELVALVLAFAAFATMGALVAARVPRNPLGWIFLTTALAAGVGGVSELLAFHQYTEGGSVPGAIVFAWLYAWFWYPTLGLVGFVMLLYPTGHVPGRRWSAVAVALGVVVGLVTLGYMTDPGPLDTPTSGLPDNPLGIGAVHTVFHETSAVGNGAAIGLLLASCASVLARFRRSRGDERQQLKWMALAVVVLALGALGPGLVGVDNSSDLVFAVTIVQLPLALGIAMFKYRLYAVDRIISRTLVYGATTALLGAAYIGLVLGGEALFSSAAGGSHLIVAASTLVVAALFLPLRRRIQTLVDRRFYRRRYDAQQTLEAFSGRLRHHVDLDALGAGLVGVIDETMRPAHVGLWLREAPR
jgi:hypothetical protein